MFCFRVGGKQAGCDHEEHSQIGIEIRVLVENHNSGYDGKHDFRVKEEGGRRKLAHAYWGHGEELTAD